MRQVKPSLWDERAWGPPCGKPYTSSLCLAVSAPAHTCSSAPLSLPRPLHLTAKSKQGCLFLPPWNAQRHRGGPVCANEYRTLQLPTVSDLFLLCAAFKAFSEILCSSIRLKSANIYLFEAHFMCWVYEGYKGMKNVFSPTGNSQSHGGGGRGRETRPQLSNTTVKLKGHFYGNMRDRD